MINKLAKTLTAYNGAQQGLNWSDSGPASDDLKDARRLAMSHGIDGAAFDTEPELIWVHPMDKSRNAKFEHAPFVTKRMPNFPQWDQPLDDGKTDTIETDRAQNLLKHDKLNPVVIVETPGKKWYVADGNHRVFLAAERKAPFRAAIYKSACEWK